jgi:hypothetical protein
MLSLLRGKPRGPHDLWQVWVLGPDERWSTIGATRSDFSDAATLAKLLSHGRKVAILPLRSRPIRSD